MHNTLLHGNSIGKKQLESCVQSIYREKLNQRELAVVVHTSKIFAEIHAQSG